MTMLPTLLRLLLWLGGLITMHARDTSGGSMSGNTEWPISVGGNLQQHNNNLQPSQVPVWHDNLTPQEAALFSPKATLHLVQHMVQHVHEQQAKHRRRRLDTTDDDTVQDLCTAIANSFATELSCQCAGALHSQTFSLICSYQNLLCGPDNQVCGRPEIALSIAQGQVLATTTCVADYVNTRRNATYQDTCLFVEVCDTPNNENNNFLMGGGPSDLYLCGCHAMYGTNVCASCDLCTTTPDNNGATTTGLSLDCSNVNAEAVHTSCQALDLDWDLAGGAGLVAQFLPSFHGLCSQLEEGVDHRVACNCSGTGAADAFADHDNTATDDHRGTYQITCETKQASCIEVNTTLYDNHNNNSDINVDTFRACGKVESTVQIREGAVEMMTSCVTLDEVSGFQETCTSFQPCSNTTTTEICDCTATFGGIPCRGCSTCSGQGSAVTVDCTNVDPRAITTCQEVDRITTLEFVPRFNFTEIHHPGGGTSTTSSGVMVGTAVSLLPLSLAVAVLVRV